jgi:hypothetical protein
VLAALVLVAAVAVGGWLALGGTRDDAAPERNGSPQSPVEEAPTGPQPGDSVDVDGLTFTAQAVDVTDSCADRAYGEVAAFFAAADCTGLSRALYATQLEGRAVVVSVVRVRMPDTATARDLQGLTDTNGTGNVNDLLREGVSYAGGPAELSGAEYASAISGPTVTIVEAAWVDPEAGGAGAVDSVASSGLQLATPPLD